MRTRTRHAAALGLLAAACACALLCSATAATAAETETETVSPLPSTDYTARAVCPPPAPRHSACLALQLVPATAQARSYTHPLGVTRASASEPPSPAAGDFGLRPQDLHSAYSLPRFAPTPQTIALVDAFNDPSAEADLNAYDREFGLPECTAANGCFKQVNERGEAGAPPFPKTTLELEAASKGNAEEAEQSEEAENWGVEISLDIEVTHATCQSCDIVLVESDSASDEDLDHAVQTAAGLGVNEISDSWGAPECLDVALVRECVTESPAFDHPGIVITASAGDLGYLGWDSSEQGYADYPASSPRVIAVGGTRLSLNEAGGWANETVWNDGGESRGVKDGHGAGGGGCSVQFNAAPWQQNVADWTSVGCVNRRAVADVSADADPYTGAAVHDSSPACDEGRSSHVVHWCVIGGTSLSAPLVASAFALAGGAHGVEYPARTLYENEVGAPGSFHDVTEGSNGACHQPFKEGSGVSGCTSAEEAHASCSAQAICLARAGYDGPTGVGTPDGIEAFQPSSQGGPGSRVPPSEEGNGGGGPPGESAGEGGPEGPAASGSALPGAGASGSSTGVGASVKAPTVQLTRLALTTKALIALKTGRPSIVALGFSFTLNLAARVHVALAKRLTTHGHASWKAAAHSLAIAATIGINRCHLGGHGLLSPGVYRLTLSPVRGAARSIVFTIR